MSTQFDPGETITGVEVDGQPTQAPPAAPKTLGPGGGSPLAKPDPFVQDMQEGFKKSMAQSETDFQDEQKILAKPRKDLLDVLQKPAAAQAHLEKVAEQPKPEDYRKGAMEFAASMAVVGAIFGRGSRNAGNAALNAFAGAMKGWKEGNLEAYTQATKEWEEATKRTIENNNQELEKYRMIIEDKKLSIDQMTAALNIVSTETGNKIMFDQTQAKNFLGAMNTYDKQSVANRRLQLALDKNQENREKSEEPLKAQVQDLIDHPERAALLSEIEWAKVKGYADTHGMTLPEHAQVREVGQPRSAPAMALKQFREQFIKEHGREPSPKEITDFSASYTGEVSEARTIGTRSGNISVATEEAANTFPLALEASKAVPRGKFVPLNQLYLKGQAALSNPDYRAFVAANEAAITAYSATMSRSGVNTVTAQNRAASVLNTADSPQAYAAAIAQLQKEVDAVRRAPAQARKQLFGDGGGPSGGAPSGTTSTGVQWSVQP